MVQLKVNQGTPKRVRPFRYEASWSKKEGCEALIKQHWGMTTGHLDPLTGSITGLKYCQEGLKNWSMEMRRNQGALIKEKLSILSSLKETNEGHLYTEISVLQKEVDSLLEAENSKWQQRAKQNWLRGGDRNTSFFHKCASQRRKQNLICNIRDNEGNETTSQKEISQIFQSFFQELFYLIKPKRHC
ncbi:uncharacterized protein LOC122310250 [Carya illinoinensis]|uniref:uncharacterized protein LOC122310250 n=1 Tax=Carya illinoinensis TaxID=32201 RepID=UPI001C717DF9|nr:uncharacterized protein LOC122310250 [Carya illinoinensis]